jgi:spermidine synthase
VAEVVLLALFGLTLFLSSALLFIVEPMFAKMVLPMLGGTPAVWNVCMVFYQALLLAGYAYAHELAKRFTPHRTALLQVLIVLAALWALPIHLSQRISPALTTSPTLWLFALLVTGVGLPFVVLTTYSSTLQTWYAGVPGVAARDPYVLYSAGNLGSLTGLISYPVLIERHLGLAAQSRVWEWGYLVLFALTICCALGAWLAPYAAPSAGIASGARTQVTRLQQFKWLALAFIPSSLMLGVTTTLTTELPPIPLLWVLPLAVYLLSFVLVFASKPIAYHAIVIRWTPVLLVVTAFLINSGTIPWPIFSIPFYLTVLFFACMACHGELARSRPPAAGLTHFYLCLAIGGASGGLFNAIIAPQIFKYVLELPLALCLLAIAVRYMGSRARQQPANQWDFVLPIVLGAVATLLAVWLGAHHSSARPLTAAVVFITPALLCLSFAERPLRFALGFTALVIPGSLNLGSYGHVLLTERSFFGVYRVTENGDYRQLSHGSTIHGVQSLDPKRTREPLSYYYPSGPIGQVFTHIGERLGEVAVIGLGAGSLACYAESGRQFTFYEIDPLVEVIARNAAYFTFLRDCSPSTRVVIGDARLRLRDAPPHRYDLLVADAFSSDTVPVHLVTREAIKLYLAKLADHGLLAFNISNRYLDLRPVLGAIARNAGLACLISDDSHLDSREQRLGKAASVWVLMARTRADFAALAADPSWRTLQVPPDAALWTDDYSTVAGIIHWTGTIAYGH